VTIEVVWAGAEPWSLESLQDAQQPLIAAKGSATVKTHTVVFVDKAGAGELNVEACFKG
jgi:hypothetical protein